MRYSYTKNQKQLSERFYSYLAEVFNKLYSFDQSEYGYIELAKKLPP
jgi:hypothetical protein